MQCVLCRLLPSHQVHSGAEVFSRSHALLWVEPFALKHLSCLGVAANGAGCAGQAGWGRGYSSRRAMGRSV